MLPCLKVKMIRFCIGVVIWSLRITWSKSIFFFFQTFSIWSSFSSTLIWNSKCQYLFLLKKKEKRNLMLHCLASTKFIMDSNTMSKSSLKIQINCIDIKAIFWETFVKTLTRWSCPKLLKSNYLKITEFVEYPSPGLLHLPMRTS